MFGPGIGIWELLIILAVIILLFGARRLPELGGAIGKTIKAFKKETTAELKEEAESGAKNESS